ncbi:hypothetical protein CXK86_20390 [Paenibacillus sp. BGI2013]|nr:hypothetical protein CXK86_20390 [Paenibacillus sp. BGI2013]
MKYSKSEFIFLGELLCIIQDELFYIPKVKKHASDLGEKTSIFIFYGLLFSYRSIPQMDVD